MTILDAHDKVYRHVRRPCALEELHGKTIALDVAWWKLRAWYADVPSYYRAADEQTHNYRATLSKLLSVLCTAIGDPAKLLLVLDGAAFWPKAAEHAKRGSSVDRDRVLAEAQAKDDGNDRASADALYKELAYPVPTLVDDWLVAHCRQHSITVICAPFEADSQAALLALSREVDAVMTVDGDLPMYGIPHVILADVKQKGQYHSVFLSDILGHEVGGLSFAGFEVPNLQDVAIAAGCDFVSRVHGWGWPTLHAKYCCLREAAAWIGVPVQKKVSTGMLSGSVIDYDLEKHWRVEYADGAFEHVTLAKLGKLRNGEAPSPLSAAGLQRWLHDHWVQLLVARNTQLPEARRITDYETMLHAAFAAFDDPIGWSEVTRPAPPRPPPRPAPRPPPPHQTDLLPPPPLRCIPQVIGGSSEVVLVGASDVLAPATLPAFADGSAAAEKLAAAVAANSRLQMVSVGDAKRLRDGDLNPRTQEPRVLPDLRAEQARGDDGNDGGESTSHVPIISQEEALGGTPAGCALERYLKNELIAWLAMKLNGPISPEMRAEKGRLIAAIRCVFELMKSGASFASPTATLSALLGWKVDDQSVERHVEQKLTDLGAIYDYVCSKLPTINDAFLNTYMPTSFRSSYQRAYDKIAGWGCNLDRFSLVPTTVIVGGLSQDACIITTDVGASQREGGNLMYYPAVCITLGADGRIFHAGSDCTCPCGICCAHGLAALLLVGMMQRSESLEGFVKACPSYSKENAVSARIISWEAVLHFSASIRKASRLREVEGDDSAAAEPTPPFSPRDCDEEEQEDSRDVFSVIEELTKLSEELDREHTEKHPPPFVFGDATFHRKLEKLYSYGLPEFNSREIPLYHYVEWHKRQN